MANIKLKCRHSIFDDISNSCQIKLPGANEFSRLDMPYRYFDNSFRIAQSTIELYTVRVLLYMYTHYSAPIAWRGKKVSSHLPCLLSRLTPISHQAFHQLPSLPHTFPISPSALIYGSSHQPSFYCHQACLISCSEVQPTKKAFIPLRIRENVRRDLREKEDTNS